MTHPDDARPDAPPGRDPHRQRPLRSRRGALSAARARPPGLRDLRRHPHRGRASRRRLARSGRAGDPGRTRTSPRSRRSIRLRCAETARIERERALHNLRRSLFDLDVHRVWERRSTAMDGVGDPLFAIFARDFAPLPDRLRAMTARMEDVPAHLAQHRARDRPPGPAVASWARPRRGHAEACSTRSRPRPRASSPTRTSSA